MNNTAAAVPGAKHMSPPAPALARLTRAILPPGQWSVKRSMLFALLLASGVLGVAAAALLDARRDAWERSSSASANLARALERDLSSGFGAVDLALRSVAELLARSDAEQISPALRQALVRDRVESARYLDAVLLVDATGAVAFDSRQRAPAVPVNFADRDYFIAHRDRGDLGLFVSRPFRSRLADGLWTIGFSRRLSHPDGGFAGIALGVIRLERLSLAFEGIQLGRRGSMTLFRQDGSILARMPADDRQLGRDLSGAPAVQRAQAEPDGQFVAISGVDAVARLYTHRRLQGAPAFINVALAIEDIYAAWWLKATAIGSVMLVLVGAMAVMFVRLQRELRRRRSLEEAARASEASFRMLTENSNDIVYRVDAEGTRLYVSPAVERVLGQPAAQLLGRSALDDIAPEDLPAVQEALGRLRAGEREVRVEYRVIRADGGVVWLEASARATVNARTGELDDIVAIARDVTERKTLENKLAVLARTDGLTGLANRRAFDEALASEWRRARRDGTALSLLLLDVDRFKLFNDTYGHPAGDACLRAVAEAVAAAVHRPADLVARYGGEEIVLLLPGTEASGSQVLAEQVRAGVEAMGLTHAANPSSGVVTVSIGAATALPAAVPDLAPEALVAGADAALYEAKHAGRNRVAVAGTVPPPPVPPPIPAQEEARLAALACYTAAGINGPAAEDLSRLTRLAAVLLGTPISAVSLVGQDRQELVARLGTEMRHTMRDISFCGHLVASSEEAFIVPDAALDPRFAGNPLVTKPPGIRFYAGAPLVCPRTRQRLGTLCVIDRAPRPMISPAQRAVLMDLAALAMDALERGRVESALAPG
jgi:diguanylate cyclase (GGDEF)-like protein/PAS domain S-box-containing protein